MKARDVSTKIRDSLLHNTDKNAKFIIEKWCKKHAKKTILGLYAIVGVLANNSSSLWSSSPTTHDWRTTHGLSYFLSCGLRRLLLARTPTTAKIWLISKRCGFKFNTRDFAVMGVLANNVWVGLLLRHKVPVKCAIRHVGRRVLVSFRLFRQSPPLCTGVPMNIPYLLVINLVVINSY